MWQPPGWTDGFERTHIMAGGFSFTHTVELNVLNWFRGTAMPTAPTSLTLALFSAVPNEAQGSGTELTGSGYARQALTFNAPAANTSPTTGSVMTNSNDIQYPLATADWLPVVAVAIFGNDGTMYMYGSLTSPITIYSGGRLEIAPGQLIDLLD